MHMLTWSWLTCMNHTWQARDRWRCRPAPPMEAASQNLPDPQFAWMGQFCWGTHPHPPHHHGSTDSSWMESTQLYQQMGHHLYKGLTEHHTPAMALLQFRYPPLVWWTYSPPTSTTLKMHQRANNDLSTWPSPMSPTTTGAGFPQTWDGRHIGATTMGSIYGLAISTATHVAMGHYTPGSLRIFHTSPTCAHPCRSPFTVLCPSHCPYQPPPRCPWQRMLPASFWISQCSPALTLPPPGTHTTDLTGIRFHLHWKQKWAIKTGSGQAWMHSQENRNVQWWTLYRPIAVALPTWQIRKTKHCLPSHMYQLWITLK